MTDTKLAPDRAETMTWRAIAGPRICNGRNGCSHPHFGRVPVLAGRILGLAPQWNFCERESCECKLLRYIDEETR